MVGIADEIERRIPHLRRFSRALIKGHDTREADDLVQEAVVAALRGNGPKRGVDLTTWCLATLVRLHRQRRTPTATPRKGTGTAEWVGKGGQVRAANAPSFPSRAVVPLDALPLECREVLLLVVLAGLSYAQVAGLLELTVEAVMARLTEARDRLAAASFAQTEPGCDPERHPPLRGSHLRVVK